MAKVSADLHCGQIKKSSSCSSSSSETKIVFPERASERREKLSANFQRIVLMEYFAQNILSTRFLKYILYECASIEFN